jgi:hypothetical protein
LLCSSCSAINTIIITIAPSLKYDGFKLVESHNLKRRQKNHILYFTRQFGTGIIIQNYGWPCVSKLKFSMESCGLLPSICEQQLIKKKVEELIINDL